MNTQNLIKESIDNLLVTVDALNSQVIHLADTYEKVVLVEKPFKPLVTHDILINEDIKKLIESGSTTYKPETYDELMEYAFIKVLSNSGAEITYEKGSGRYFSRIKVCKPPVEKSFFEPGKYYLVKYVSNTRGFIEWARELQVEDKEFIKMAKSLASICGFIKRNS